MSTDSILNYSTRTAILEEGITLIIPVFNRAGIVSHTLRSVELQTRRPDRVILVDNNSTDNSLEVISDWARMRSSEGWNVDVVSESSPGAAAARKRGENMVTTRYLYFFDSDDIMSPALIERAMRDFEENPDLKITAWSLTFINPDGSRRQRIIHPDRPLENHLVQGLLSTQAYAAETEYFRNAGGWKPELEGWDDWELGLRLLLGGGQIKITKESRADITVHEDSITGLSYLHRKGNWEKTLDEMEQLLSDCAHPDRDYILRMLSYRRAILAAHYYREGDKKGAKVLLRTAIDNPDLSKLNRNVINLAFWVTAFGLRGAGLIFPPMLTK